MTLIIGARCQDGVILAADQKISRGGETDYRSKLSEVGGVVLAFEGLAGLSIDFLYSLETEFNTLDGGFSSLLHAKILIEDLVKEYYERYYERIGQDAFFGALIAGLREIRTGPAQLYYIHPQGYGEAVDYRCSGHGAPHAHTIARSLIAREEPVEVNGFRSAFVVGWVGDGIDSTVGGEPQVAMLSDDVPDIIYLDTRITTIATDHAKDLQANLLTAFDMSKDRLEPRLSKAIANTACPSHGPSPE